MNSGSILEINSITQLHQILGLKPPKHPLISVIYYKDIKDIDFDGMRAILNLYMISLKENHSGSFGYGRISYDFTEGVMVFTKPNQILEGKGKRVKQESKSWMLVFHPNLISRSHLAKTIDSYSYFSYDVHEALHLSDDEKQTLNDLVSKIQKEYSMNLDKHSQKLIISTIELLLDYCNRFYDRQFFIRTNHHQELASKFENILKAYYNSEKPMTLGIPSVKYCAEELHISPNYLSDLLKKETGKNAKEHIYFFLIQKAKNLLLGTSLSISEIAYDLGFEYPQHFSKLFKQKIGISPAKYRSLN
ncbi:helix-turn-helix domain-containing protein [Aureivirga marina]|uniref:helix-turn-helix domain-containing protein n=1 Tax=Aureivirga marina TaxID=1182451 RepID=UPI0018CB3EF3|nr:helix-turn-helix domain-containing protein [Aureivirga marina]